MNKAELEEKLQQYQTALDGFVERLREDRYVLAVVLSGSICEETVWRKESIHVWVIEADGVTKRLKADGNNERIFRIFVEEDINIHAEMIPRSRFRMMVEGSSRTAFSCSFFAKRELIYSDDKSISQWFQKANKVATKDKDRELLDVTTWAIHAHRHARKLFEIKKDLNLCKESVVWTAHAIACMEQVRRGEVREHDVIYEAIEQNPDLFQVLYLDVIARKPMKKTLSAAIDAARDYIEEHYKTNLKPVIQYLKKQRRVVPLSEVSEHFAYTQVYPGHIECACDWLYDHGYLEKVSAPFRITKKSRVEVEEPAYQWM